MRNVGTCRRESVAVGVGRLLSQNPHEDEDDCDENDESDPENDVEGDVVDAGGWRDGRGGGGGGRKFPIIGVESGIVRHLAVHHKLVRIWNKENKYYMHNLFSSESKRTSYDYRILTFVAAGHEKEGGLIAEEF